MANVKKVKVKLKKPHIHAGERYGVGAEIEVTEKQVEWLKERGIV